MDNREISEEERLEIIEEMLDEWDRTGLEKLSLMVLTRATVLKDETLLELFSRANNAVTYNEWSNIYENVEYIMQTCREELEEQ